MLQKFTHEVVFKILCVRQENVLLSHVRLLSDFCANINVAVYVLANELTGVVSVVFVLQAFY